MAVYTLLIVLALASTSVVAPYIPPGPSTGSGSGTGDVSFRSGLIPDSSSTGFSASSSVSGNDSPSFQDFQQRQLGQDFSQAVRGADAFQTFGSIGQDGRSSSQSSGSPNVQTGFAPKYEEHIEARSGVVPVTTTITNRVTQTHTLRVPSTSDVWVTSVTMMKMPVTQLTTQRSYVPEAANTVTSVIRITKTPIEVVTRTAEIYPTKTLVSVFTRFVTETETVELWQNIVHRATNYEVLTVPVLETQTLLQRLFTTITVTRTVDITSVEVNIPRAGEIRGYY